MAQLDRRAKEYKAMLNHPLIRGRKVIGKGCFSTVFDNGSTVLKLTIDDYSHHFLGDYRLNSVYMPRKTHSWGCVGIYKEQNFWLLEMERLHKLKPGEDAYNSARELEQTVYLARKRLNFDVKNAKTLVETMLKVCDWPLEIRKDLWSHLFSLADFADEHGAMLDIHRGNWMKRDNGDMVFCDPLVNIETW